MEQLLVKKLRPGAVLPCRGTPGSAGADLCACLEQPLVLNPGETVKIPTGIAVSFGGADRVALVFGRSGLGINHGIVPANAVGVVDSDYRGEIIVGLRNASQSAYTLQNGDRIAQLVVVPVLTPEILEVSQLDDTQRGVGGFGSTGR